MTSDNFRQFMTPTYLPCRSNFWDHFGPSTYPKSALKSDVIIGLPFQDLRLDEGYFLQDNQCTLAFPKYLLHGLNDMQARQLARRYKHV